MCYYRCHRYSHCTDEKTEARSSKPLSQSWYQPQSPESSSGSWMCPLPQASGSQTRQPSESPWEVLKTTEPDFMGHPSFRRCADDGPEQPRWARTLPRACSIRALWPAPLGLDERGAVEICELPLRRRTQGQAQMWVTRASLAGGQSKQSLGGGGGGCEFRGSGRPSFSKETDKLEETRKPLLTRQLASRASSARARRGHRAHLWPRATVSSKWQLPPQPPPSRPALRAREGWGGCQPFPPPPSSSPAVHTLRKAWTLSPALGTLPVPGVSPDGPPTVPPFAPLSLHSFCLWPLNSDYFFFTFMGEGWAIGCALVAAANSHIPPLLALALPGWPQCQGTEPGLRAAHRERGPFSSSHLAPSQSQPGTPRGQGRRRSGS